MPLKLLLERIAIFLFVEHKFECNKSKVNFELNVLWCVCLSLVVVTFLLLIFCLVSVYLSN